MVNILKRLPAAVPALFVLGVFAHAALAADSTPNDAARFLAGMPPAADSPLAKRAEEGNWKRHARYFDESWKKLETRQLSKIRDWQGKNLTSPQQTMFYMFSGPDYLYADAFFPKATTYVLCGLEPVGKVPELSDLPARSLEEVYGAMRTSLNSVLNYSFFITKNMQSQLKASKANGTLPAIYIFLARAGKAINEVSYVDLDMDGNEQPAGKADEKTATKGVKIGFSAADGRKQTLYYFTTDLSNDGIKKSGFMKFSEKLGPGDSFIKSASYLMHSGGFSGVRDFLLQHSAALVQDDSGIPVSYFKDGEWDLKPFGNYLGPISLFRGNYQSKLAKLFKQGGREPIPFGVGYRWRSNESNLLLAVKKQAQSAAK